MGKIKQALTIGAIGFIEAVRENTQDPILKAILVPGSYALLIPYAILKELYTKEPDELLRELVKSGKVTTEIIKSPQFQQALGNTFQNMISAKEKERRDVIRRAFTGAYISQDEYAINHLERLQEAAIRLSIPALQHLSFLNNVILPMVTKTVEYTSKRQIPLPGYTETEWNIELRRTTPISTTYDLWYKLQRRKAIDTSDNNYAEVKQRKQRSQFMEYWVEYNTLGIFRQGTATDSIGGGGTVHYLTEFGDNLIKYVSSVSKIIE